MHFDQHRHAQAQRLGFQIGHQRVVQAGGDQQDAVCAPGARLVDLVGVDHEVLAQHRQRAHGARLLQVLGCALKERPIGEHAQAGGAVPGIGHRDLGRHEVLADHALARAGLLDLGDDRGLAGSNLRAQGADEIARRRLRQRVAAQRGGIAPALRRSDLLTLDGDDALQDVAHLPTLRAARCGMNASERPCALIRQPSR